MHYTRTDGLTEEQEGINRRMAAKGIEFFVESTASTKTALVAIEQYVPEVRDRLTSGW